MHPDFEEAKQESIQKIDQTPQNVNQNDLQKDRASEQEHGLFSQELDLADNHGDFEGN